MLNSRRRTVRITSAKKWLRRVQAVCCMCVFAAVKFKRLADGRCGISQGFYDGSTTLVFLMCSHFCSCAITLAASISPRIGVTLSVGVCLFHTSVFSCKTDPGHNQHLRRRLVDICTDKRVNSC
ncbi:UNVERIFIED_CONTAM: hypothetical protein HHA_449420 [Hammondia hammondi]|eukprot:XP_008882099.1 hypothetical protein HHA_449420 [Hammondia hammondi]